MKRIIINSNLNLESVALMCAHIQNVQTRSVVITDSFTLLRYGEKFNIEPEKLTEKNLTNIYCSKHDDVVLAVYPDLIKVTTVEELDMLLTSIESLITDATLETVEATTVYFGSTILSLDFLENFAGKYETTLVDLNNYKHSSKFTDKFNWNEEVQEETQTEMLAYTCIFDKRLHKKATTLKRPVLLIGPKDLLVIMDRERADDWKLTGLMKSLAVEIVCKHTGVNKEAVEAWIATPATK